MSFKFKNHVDLFIFGECLLKRIDQMFHLCSQIFLCASFLGCKQSKKCAEMLFSLTFVILISIPDRDNIVPVELESVTFLDTFGW